MPFTREQILELYRSEAQKHQEGGTSTIQDARTRELELQAIFSYLRDGMKILEIGGGNGFVAQTIVENFAVEIESTDFSPDMVAIAKKRKIPQAKGKVKYSQLDVLALAAERTYDLVFTERCIQNLVSWEDQKKALANIARSLKPGGQYVMLECFWTGLNNLNAARAELDLPKIDQSWHNLYFEEDQTKAHLNELGCRYVDQNRFLSGYYFGSRVLLPALMPKGKPVASKSILNDYFSGLPPHGDFCPMKILRFVKK